MATHARGLISFDFLIRSALWMMLMMGVLSPRARGEDPFKFYDLAMYDRPSFSYPDTITVFPEGLESLWMKALARPDAELQRLVIDTIAIAHHRGMEDLDKHVPRLLRIAGERDQRLDVLRAVAQTLIVLDARESAEPLANLATTHGLSLAQIVEPALAKWESPVMKDNWLQRVAEANASHSLMLLAIRGVAALKVADAAAPLQRIILNPGERMQIRLEAAKALGNIDHSTLGKLSEALLDEPSVPAELHPLIVIGLLASHEDAASVDLLDSLVAFDSTTVQSRALEELYEIDIDLVDRHASELLTSEDVNVRRTCARAMVAKQDVARIEPLCAALDDVNPSLRREIAQSLIDLAAIPKLRDEVILQTEKILGRDNWRGCEQACVVLARLDHEPGGPRIVELLGHQRGEVKVASAWALKQLKVKDLLPDMLDHAQSVYDGFRSGQINDAMPGASLQIAHLFIGLGDQRYQPANELMRAYLPKDYSLGIDSRAAAAWALGMIYEEDPQSDITKTMVERLADVESEFPEADQVRRMCALSIGRMNSESALPDLREFARHSDPVSLSCYWSIQRMTGEEPPPIKVVVDEVSGWFLSPL